jgi:hypothetical protein
VYQNDTQVTAGMNVMQPFGMWDHYIVYDEKWGNDESYFIHVYDISTGNDLTIATGNVRSYGCVGGEANNGKVALVFGGVYNQIKLYDINSGATDPVDDDLALPQDTQHRFVHIFFELRPFFPAFLGQRLAYKNQEQHGGDDRGQSVAYEQQRQVVVEQQSAYHRPEHES